MPITATSIGEADETLRRSELMSNVQRAGIVAMVVALVACVGTIGWAPMIALGIGLVAFLAMKVPAVRDRLGVWSIVLAWVLGQSATFIAVVVADGPTEYVVMMLGIPTILASAVWPHRYVRLGAGATWLLVIAAGAVGEGRGVIDRYPAFLIPATTIAAMTWLSISARRAESDSLVQLLTDPLTGLPNRFALARERATLEASPSPEPIVMMVIDVDHFKRINDTSGHATGDEVLRHVGQLLTDELGERGSLVRYGGEEFVAIIRGSMTAETGGLAESMRRRVAGMPFLGEHLTISIGLAAHPDARTGFGAAFDAADAALYRAKADGRNRVVRSDDEVPPAPPEQRRAQRASTDHDVLGAVTRRSPHRAPLLVDLIERAHLVGLTRRLHRSNPVPMVAVYLSAIVSIPKIGWAMIPAAAVGSLVFRAVQARIATFAHPIQTLGAAWLIAQITIVSALPLMRGDTAWLICVAAAMAISASATFPLRYIVGGLAITSSLMLGGALTADPDVLQRAPQVVAINIAYLVASAITGRAVGTLAIRMRGESHHDATTGLPNRAALNASGGAVVEDADDRGVPIGVIVADIDHFKSVNDRNGHTVGDQAIVGVASTLQAALRPDTMLFRVGGEEFAVLVPEADGEDARSVAERLRQAVAYRADLPGGPLTVSLGVATRTPGAATTFAELMDLADRAMYRSKEDGRNRTTVADLET